jgi:hypothetical protein
MQSKLQGKRATALHDMDGEAELSDMLVHVAVKFVTDNADFRP